MEIGKFKELKKRIDYKISDNYVYFNRRYIQNLLKIEKKTKIIICIWKI